MSKVYIYVVARDFGFAPNPFHKICTLATCKPDIRRVARKDDWIIGMGGSRLKATSRCVFAMRVSDSITFDEYWENPAYRDKKPIRNGSKKMIVGDNIYHKVNGDWQQLNSHHSYSDGSPNPHNIRTDTRTNAVLISDHFFYFGSAAIEVPLEILRNMGYENRRAHRTFEAANAQALVSFIEKKHQLNFLAGDPFDFDAAKSRYSVKSDKVTLSTS
ncbi:MULTISPECIES: Nmad2 family putative nucleotide modification protein [Pseudomonas syringae group]|uniref:Nmad2 family putative nucleotide modification protein n=1 Tax=Pseudomonas syringae group TaxID=136849 RepID=UPI0009B2D044|nr:MULTISPECIES: hypothetical protein [Pseudomonas syringae group]